MTYINTAIKLLSQGRHVDAELAAYRQGHDYSVIDRPDCEDQRITTWRFIRTVEGDLVPCPFTSDYTWADTQSWALERRYFGFTLEAMADHWVPWL